MRKLILQMQLSVDGFSCGPAGEMNWVDMNWSDDINAYVSALTTTTDCIVMGHTLAQGFIPHWQQVADAAEAGDVFAGLMDQTPKLVFSRQASVLQTQLKELCWRNTRVATLPLQDEILQLKRGIGKDIMCYGGVEFVSELIKFYLIDEYYLFINPTAIGKGKHIFSSLTFNLPLQSVSTQRFDNGIVLNHYRKS